MSYLLDKKEKKRRFWGIAIGVVVFFALFYFRTSFFGGFSYVSQGIFHPIWVVGNNIGEKFKNLGAYFISKSSLSLQNENLHSQLNEEEARILNYNSVLEENESLKEILGRMDTKKSMILGVILSKPNRSPYDTLVLDVGTEEGIDVGSMVFAFGNIPVGYVAEAFPSSAKVTLFSNAGEKTQAIVTLGRSALGSSPTGEAGRNIFFELVGRGGGNFEMILPRDLILQKGDLVTMPGINPYTLARVETIISDPRDPFTKALLSSPVNIQELKFVEVEI
ncbi:MAG: rod shape-determining protein MreC [Minisyncoccia bacterium]